MATMRNFHVPLSEELYNRIHEQAKQRKCSATELARNAIQSWLKEKEKENLHAAIAQYARQNAGSKLDLAEDVETAATEFLLSEENQ